MRDIFHQNEEINQGGKHGLKRHSSEKSEGESEDEGERSLGRHCALGAATTSPDWSGPSDCGESVTKASYIITETLNV